jgi:hypothetical protein
MYNSIVAEEEVRNPNWGGPRPGAGRRAESVKLSRQEVELLLRGLNGFKRDSPLGQLVARLRAFVDRS